MKTRHLLLTGMLALAGMFATPAVAQIAYAKGETDVHLGIGLLPTFYGSGYRVGLPPVSVSFERGVADNIGVGAFAALSTARTKKYNYLAGEYWWRYSYILLCGRAAYHFQLVDDEKLDTYAGAILGYRIGISTFHSTDPNLDEDLFDADGGAGATYGFFGGARYQATDKLRIFGEVGYGIAILNVGLNFKLAEGDK